MMYFQRAYALTRRSGNNAFGRRAARLHQPREEMRAGCSTGWTRRCRRRGTACPERPVQGTRVYVTARPRQADQS